MREFVKGLLGRVGLTVIRPPSMACTDPFLAMRQLLQHVTAPVIVDVGAFRGNVAIEFSRCFPEATVYALEPFPESFALMERNVAGYPKIVPLNKGLADHEGLRTLHVNKNSATNSVLASSEGGMQLWGGGILETRGTVEASFTTLDALMDAHGLQQIDILKLDVQGAESLVLDGAVRACRQGRVRIIYTEVIMQPTYEQQPRLDQVIRAFYERGFSLFGIYNLNWSSSGLLRQVDGIFVRDNDTLQGHTPQEVQSSGRNA